MGRERMVAVEAKPFHLSKTMIVSALTIAAGLIQLLVQNLELSANVNAVLLTIAGVIFAVLRSITMQPVTMSTSPQPGVAPAPKLGEDV